MPPSVGESSVISMTPESDVLAPPPRPELRIQPELEAKLLANTKWNRDIQNVNSSKVKARIFLIDSRVRFLLKDPVVK